MNLRVVILGEMRKDTKTIHKHTAKHIIITRATKQFSHVRFNEHLKQHLSIPKESHCVVGTNLLDPILKAQFNKYIEKWRFDCNKTKIIRKVWKQGMFLFHHVTLFSSMHFSHPIMFKIVIHNKVKHANMSNDNVKPSPQSEPSPKPDKRKRKKIRLCKKWQK